MEGCEYIGDGEGIGSAPLLTLIYPYYNNHDMLVHHQHEHWMRYPIVVRECIEVIVVDDCSPRKPALRAIASGDLGYAFRLYRIKKDVRWNWIAARNLGAHEAKKSWLFMTDMDHVLTVSNIEILLQLIMGGKLDKKKYYTFDRKDAPDLTPYKNHPNTYLIHRDLFWKNGGYDEEFSGYYGTDGYYRKLLDKVSEGEHLDGVFVVRYPREVIGDASTVDYERKTEFDKSKKLVMRAKFAEERPQKVLTFPWERLI